MLTRVVKSVFVVMGLSLALACGGAETADAEQLDSVSDAQSPTTDAAPGDVSAAQIGGVCGGFKQACCEGKYCNGGYDCNTTTNKCLL